MSAVDRLVASWDAQQAAYIARREERFTVMLDVLASTWASTPQGEGRTVLDVACGPGSLSARLLERFPAVRVIGLDYDPVLLAVAGASLAAHGSRFTALDADLTAPGWTGLLPVERLDAAVSSTALHWLTPAELVAVYAALRAVIRPDGVLLNADHLRYDAQTQPELSRQAEADDAATQEAAFASGVPTWDEWWASALAVPELARHAEERERRFADRPPTPLSPLALHLEGLRAGGFRETGTVWQYYDDFVVFARR